MKRYELTVLFTVEAESPEDAADSLYGNLRRDNNGQELGFSILDDIEEVSA
jgi:hypothetical protein